MEEVDPEQMPEDVTSGGSYYIDAGKVYQDPNTGKLYLVQENGAAEGSEGASGESGASTSASAAASAGSSASRWLGAGRRRRGVGRFLGIFRRSGCEERRANGAD